MKHIGAIVVAFLLIFFISFPVHAQTASPVADIDSYNKLLAQAPQGQTLGVFDDIIRFIGGILFPAQTDKIALCKDAMEALDPNPELADEHRMIGSVTNCNIPPVGTVTYGLKVIKTVEIPITATEWGAELAPAEVVTANLTGSTKSSTTEGGAPVAQDIRGYLGYGAGYKVAQDEIRRLLIRRENGPPDPALEIAILNNTGVAQRSSEFLCGGILCEIFRREQVLKTIAVNYVFSKTIAPLMGLNPDDKKNYGYTQDVLLGWLHAPCHADGSCAFGGYVDTVFSTAKLSFKTTVPQIPVYGIWYFCYKGMSLPPGVPGSADQLCNILFGGDYRSGRISPDGEYWKTLTNFPEAGDRPHEDAFHLTLCGDSCRWATAGSGEGAGSGSADAINGDKVGPELPYPEAGEKVIAKLNYTGTLSVINDIGQPPTNYTPNVPGRKMSLRVNLNYSTQNSALEKYATALRDSGDMFPDGTIVILGNEVNNLKLEWQSPNQDPSYLGTAGADYAKKFNTFAEILRGNSKFRVAPSPPDLYNGDFPPIPWLNGFKPVVDCSLVDVLVANIFEADVRPDMVGLGYSNLEIWKFYQNDVCNGSKKVVHFQGWGTHPDKSLSEQKEFLDKTPLPEGIETATTLIVDNCGDKKGNELKADWMSYIPFKIPVYRHTGVAVDPATCGESEGDGTVTIYTTDRGLIYNAPTQSIEEWGASVKEIFNQGPDDPPLRIDQKLDRTTELSFPGGANFDWQTAQNELTRYMPFTSVMAARGGQHQIPSNYVEQTVVNGAVADAAALGELPELASRTFLVIDKNITPPTDYDPNDPNAPTTRAYNFERGLTIEVSIPKAMEQYLRYTVNEKYGLGNIFLSKPVSDAFHLKQNGVSLANAPNGEGTIQCEADTNCTQNASIKNVTGGVNLLFNPDFGAAPCSTLPFPACAGEQNAGRIIREHAMRVEQEKMMTNWQPWENLLSFSEQLSTQDVSLQK